LSPLKYLVNLPQLINFADPAAQERYQTTHERKVELHSLPTIVPKFLSFTKDIEDHVNDVSFID